MKLAIFSLFFMTVIFSSFANPVFISPDDGRLSYSDCFSVGFPDAKNGRKVARFSRPGKTRKGYEFDTPGARLRFRTDAPSCAVKLRYSELHVSTSARNPVGAYMIDGNLEPEYRFRTKQRGVKREVEEVEVELRAPTPGMHTYEIIMPYGDSVDVLGLSAPAESVFEKPAPRPALRCAFYGDSVTHGFTAESIVGTYPFLTARMKNFQMVNVAIGGRGVASADGKTTALAKCDIVVVHIGVNNWQGGTPLDLTKKRFAGFLKALRSLQPDVPLYVVTPLWVADSWKPKRAKFPLGEYRRVLREAVEESGDSKAVVIDGTKMIDHDKKYFDRVLVHPNDEGFEQMAQRLAREILLPPPKK